MLSMSKLAMVGALALVGVARRGMREPPSRPQHPTPTPDRQPRAWPRRSRRAPARAWRRAPGRPQSRARAAVASPAASAPAASGATTTVSLEARDLSFAPRELEAPADQPFDLTLHNAGVIVHNVTIDAPGVQLVVSPGQTGTTVVEGLRARQRTPSTARSRVIGRRVCPAP